MAEEKGQRMINEKAFGVSFIPVLVVRRIISLPRWIFLFSFGLRGQFGPVEVFWLQQWGTEGNMGRFLSLTVIMQLVFECSYHTNVDHLHFQTCVPGFLSVQHTSFHFTLFFFSNLCPQPSGSQCAAHFLSSCTYILEADVRIWV